jgi:hypothetical protein
MTHNERKRRIETIKKPFLLSIVSYKDKEFEFNFF